MPGGMFLIEGFENWPTGINYTSKQRGLLGFGYWVDTVDMPVVDLGAGIGRALHIPSHATVPNKHLIATNYLFTPNRKIVIGFSRTVSNSTSAISGAPSVTGEVPIFENGANGTTPYFKITADEDGFLHVRNYSDSIVHTVNTYGLFNHAKRNYIEICIDMSNLINPEHTLHVKLNGTYVIIDYKDDTLADSPNRVYGTHMGIYGGSDNLYPNGSEIFIDDIYLGYFDVTPDDGFLGPQKIDYLKVVNPTNTTNAIPPDDSAINWLNINKDEIPLADSTIRNESFDTATNDLFKFEYLDKFVGDISAISIDLMCRNRTQDFTQSNVEYKQDGVKVVDFTSARYYGAGAVDLSIRRKAYLTDINGSAWTKNSLNSIEAGYSANGQSVYHYAAFIQYAVPDPLYTKNFDSLAEDGVMVYEDIEFPACLSYGSEFQIRYFTNKAEVLNQQESRNARGEYPRHKYSLLMENFNALEIADIIRIYHICGGDHIGFMFEDPEDNTSNDDVNGWYSGNVITGSDQFLAIGDGVTVEWPLYKYYTVNGRQRRRRIYHPVVATLLFEADNYDASAMLIWDAGTKTVKWVTPLSLNVTLNNVAIVAATDRINNFDASTWSVGMLVWTSGGTGGQTYYPSSGPPLRVVAKDASGVELKQLDGSSPGMIDEANTNITIVSVDIPPSGMVLRCGYRFKLATRFDDATLSLVPSDGQKDTTIANLDNVVLLELFE